MEARSRDLIVYRTPEGVEPFTEWFSKLKDLSALARITRRLDRLEMGNFGDCKSVGEGVLELRIPYGPGYRIYIAKDGARILILLCGGDKRTQSSTTVPLKF